jgi:hypothetical protein
MAIPMTPDQALAVFRKEGLQVVEIPGWRTNDRAPATGRPAGPKHGLVNHHTGGDTTNPYAYAAGILSKGSSALVGPLCHQGLDPDTGTLYMVGTGRTNHAGGGDPKVLAAVTADAVPYDRELKPTKGNLEGVDGNAPFYGLEVMYSGARDVPRVGYVAMVRWNTAICRFHSWTGASAIAHREWSDDKPDPGHVNLPQLRRDVDAALALPPGAWGSTVTTPPPLKPTPAQEDDMPIFASTTPAEGGRIYMLVPGRPKLWLNPQQWALWRRQAPAATDLAAHGSPYLESEVDMLWASIQPAGVALETPAANGSRGITVDDVAEQLAPDCAEPSKHNI